VARDAGVKCDLPSCFSHLIKEVSKTSVFTAHHRKPFDLVGFGGEIRFYMQFYLYYDISDRFQLGCLLIGYLYHFLILINIINITHYCI